MKETGKLSPDIASIISPAVPTVPLTNFNNNRLKTNITSAKSLLARLTDYGLIGILLLAALLGAWLPVEWTRSLKRPQQAPNYVWLNVAYCLLFIAAAWWCLRKSPPVGRLKGGWLALGLLVVAPNLFNIWLRYSSPLTATDPRPLFGRDADIGLFYEYGLALTERRWPVNPAGQFAEYPQLSFPIFWLGVLLSGSNLEVFYWMLPVMLLVAQMGAAAGLYGLGLKLERSWPAFLLAAFAAGCPALYLFGYTRFDIVPTALLLGGVYLAVPGKMSGVKGLAERRRWGWQTCLSGMIISAGTLVKWLPGIIWPWLVLAYWHSGNRSNLFRFIGASIGLGLLLTVPLLIINAPALLYPYQFQGSRRLIGESVWFLFQNVLLDAAHTVPDKPWGEPARVLLDNNTLLLSQLALVSLTLGSSLWRLWPIHEEQAAFRGWAVAGLVAVAVFTLSNRIFSPQYLVLLVWVWAAALLLLPVTRLRLATGFVLISLAATANFEVYLLGAYPESWMRDSAILFLAGFGLCSWLLWLTLAQPSKI